MQSQNDARNGQDQATAPQAIAPAKKSGGRKRKRAHEVAEFIRREVPGAFRRSGGNLEAVAEDFGMAKIEVLSVVTFEMIQRIPPNPASVVREFHRRIA